MKKNSIAVCAYRMAGRTKREKFSYTTIEELLYKVFNFECVFRYKPDIFLVHDVENGLAYRWNSNLAHYCFAEGRISETELIGMLNNPIQD